MSEQNIIFKLQSDISWAHGIFCEVSVTNIGDFFENDRLIIEMCHKNVLSRQDLQWEYILKQCVGKIAISKDKTTQYSQYMNGETYDLGYDNLDKQYRAIYNGQNIGSGDFCDNDVVIYAKRYGDDIILRVDLIDDYEPTDWTLDNVSNGSCFALFSELGSAHNIKCGVINNFKSLI